MHIKMANVVEWLAVSLSWKTVFLTACLCVLSMYIYWKEKKKNLPPGPCGVPFFGYYPFLGKQPHITLAKLAQRYGDIMSLSMGGTLAIHLNSPEVIKEALIKQGDAFGSRPSNNFHFWFTNGLGIVQADGTAWQEHRHFMVRTLREMGMGKQSLECRVTEVAQSILQTLKGSQGRPLDLHPLITNATYNVITSLMFNTRYELDDQEYRNINSSIQHFFQILSILDTFFPTPWSRILGIDSGAHRNGLSRDKAILHSTIHSIIQRHCATLDNNNIRDYTDAFLTSRAQLLENGDSKASIYSMETLSGIAVNMLVAGTATIICTLDWALYVLAMLPNIQREVQKEIDEVVGRDRLPTWSDRTDMPYSLALIQEALRFAVVSVIPPVHRTTRETTLRGYTIPADSVIMTNFWTVHTDPKYWKDPHLFDPTRFLDSSNNLISNDNFFPFGIGKRACLGESLARMELFMFLTSILQQFNLYFPPGQELSYHSGLVRTLEPFQVCATLR